MTVDQLDDPDARHTTDQEVQVIENYVRLVPRAAGLGWTVGANMHVNAFGIWGFAILTSPTLRAAVQTSIDYIKLSSLIADMSLAESNGRASLAFDMAELPSTVHHFIFERHAAVAANFIEEIAQAPGKAVFHIETMDSDAEYGHQLSHISGLPVAIGMPTYALSFSADLLDQPLPKSDPVSLRFCLEQCEALAEREADTLASWSKKVRDLIVEDVSFERKIEEICEKLGVTERTLRRRLTEEGTSFRKLYTDVRLALAHELLEVAGLNVETVAWRVGYAETASFARAFTKKYVITPGKVRT